MCMERATVADDPNLKIKPQDILNALRRLMSLYIVVIIVVVTSMMVTRYGV
jgi:ethanolamine utilization cobalamin adenosyltransferase